MLFVVIVKRPPYTGRCGDQLATYKWEPQSDRLGPDEIYTGIILIPILIEYYTT